MAVQHRVLGRARREVIDGDLHAAPVGIALVAIVAHRAHRAHDELAVVHDGPLVHEPRPRAVVVQLNQLAGHVVRGKIGGDGYQRRQQTQQPEPAHRVPPDVVHGAAVPEELSRDSSTPDVYRARGSGRSCKCRTLLVVPLPPSMWNGARVLTVAQNPRPCQPAFGSTIRPSIHFVWNPKGYGTRSTIHFHSCSTSSPS